MNNASLPIMAGMVWLSFILSGCDTTQEHRARQYSQAYNALPEDMQQRSISGQVQIGDTPQAVYIAMGTPQKIETIKRPDGVYEDYWIYLGKPAPKTEALPTGKHQYITVNDFIWSNPFDRSATQRIAVVFLGDYLERIEIQNSDGKPLNLAFPSIVLPQNPPVSAPDAPLPADSSSG